MRNHTHTKQSESESECNSHIKKYLDISYMKIVCMVHKQIRSSLKQRCNSSFLKDLRIIDFTLIFYKNDYLLSAPGRYGSISATTIKWQRYHLSCWNRCRNSCCGQQTVVTGCLKKDILLSLSRIFLYSNFD